MPATERVKILCVDDEPRVLEGLALHLRRIFEMTTATSGREGLEILARQGPFTVVLSDMRMPGMDGAEFLSKVRLAAPDTTRMLLTGDADLQSAIAAVNEGQIFRFLTKPCAPYQLRLAFEAAAIQYRLVTAERVLLEQTVHGAVKTLTDILALTSPLAFGRAARIRQHVRELAEELQVANRWQIEVAAMLSQLGSITIPEETIKRYYYGEVLSEDENAMIGRMPAVAEELLANIPRLEPVRAILARHAGLSRPGSSSGGMKDAEVAVAASILGIAVEFDEIESRGLSAQLALDKVMGREGAHDPAILQAFARLRGSAAASQHVQAIPLRSLRVGMVLAEDMRTKAGLLLVTRGFEVTPSFLEKTWNQREGYVKEPLLVNVGTSKEQNAPKTGFDAGALAGRE